MFVIVKYVQHSVAGIKENHVTSFYTKKRNSKPFYGSHYFHVVICESFNKKICRLKS